MFSLKKNIAEHFIVLYLLYISYQK